MAQLGGIHCDRCSIERVKGEGIGTGSSEFGVFHTELDVNLVRGESRVLN